MIELLKRKIQKIIVQNVLLVQWDQKSIFKDYEWSTHQKKKKEGLSKNNE